MLNLGYGDPYNWYLNKGYRQTAGRGKGSLWDFTCMPGGVKKMG